MNAITPLIPGRALLLLSTRPCPRGTAFLGPTLRDGQPFRLGFLAVHGVHPRIHQGMSASVSRFRFRSAGAAGTRVVRPHSRHCGTSSRLVLNFSRCMGFIPRSTRECQPQSAHIYKHSGRLLSISQDDCLPPGRLTLSPGFSGLLAYYSHFSKGQSLHRVRRLEPHGPRLPYIFQHASFDRQRRMY